jgi:hypothetical protein
MEQVLITAPFKDRDEGMDPFDCGFEWQIQLKINYLKQNYTAIPHVLYNAYVLKLM